ncbi:hypothetical protein D9M69_406790 [compost metagenome]
MKQVIFPRVRPAGGRSNVSGRACACHPVISASHGCHAQLGSDGDPLRQRSLRAELSLVRHHRRHGLFRLADSPACDAIARFDAHRLDCRCLVLLCIATLLRRAVTMALHARNAKKISCRKTSLESSVIRVIARNACQSTPIFSENASVSYAVDSSFDHMMLNRNRTTDFPHWPTFVEVLTLVRTRSQSALRPRAGQVSAL